MSASASTAHAETVPGQPSLLVPALVPSQVLLALVEAEVLTSTPCHAASLILPASVSASPQQGGVQGARWVDMRLPTLATTAAAPARART